MTKLPWVYLDTSTYLKLYVKENGSQEVRNVVRNNRILSSAILLTECFSAISRKRHIGEIDDKDFDNLVSRIKEGVQYIEIVRLTDEVLVKAEAVALQSTARALDAIHIASAIIFQEATRINVTFVTSDKKQQEVANHQGLKTLLIS
jgi:predicted nucleic acid-binding protein